jgi:hypothetical protein
MVTGSNEAWRCTPLTTRHFDNLWALSCDFCSPNTRTKGTNVSTENVIDSTSNKIEVCVA